MLAAEVNELISKEALHKKSPQEITGFLYEACLDNLEEAKLAIDEKNYIDANRKLQKANDILYRLGAGINYEAGIIADQLDSIYNYLADRVVKANYDKDTVIIDEVIKNIQVLSEAWVEALKTNTDPDKKSQKLKRSAYEKNVMFE